MTDQVRALDCPSCGAPLEMPRERQRFFQCEFCGDTLEDQTTPQERAAGQYPRIIIHTALAETLAPEISKGVKRATRTVGCVALGLVLLCVGIALAATGALTTVELPDGELSLSERPNDGPRVYNFGLTRMLPADDDTQADVVGVTRNSDDTRRMVYVDFDAEQPLRWQSEALGEGADYVYNHVVADSSSVYMAYETTLAAFDRQDGTIAWQAALSDEIRNICQDCLQVFGGRVLALTADGVLSGIDAQTGDLAWSARLSDTPRQLLNLAGQAGVLDEDDNGMGISVYQAESGDLAGRIVPQCPNEVFSNHPQMLRIYDPLLVADDGKNLYVPIGDYEPGCIQNWDAESLTLTWQASVPRDVVQSLDRNPYLLTSEALYTSDGHNLFVVSLQDGAFERLFSDEDHNLFPLAVQDGRLLVLAERTRGTQQHALWGIDIGDGAKRWQFDPDAQDLYDEGGSNVVHSNGMWSAGMAQDEVVVLQAFSDPSFVTFTLLNLTDGVQTGSSKFEIQDASSSYWIAVLGWRRDQVYLEMDSRLRVMDFATATDIAVWP
jgi:outer membrane protein assembly factor BamB